MNPRMNALTRCYLEYCGNRTRLEDVATIIRMWGTLLHRTLTSTITYYPRYEAACKFLERNELLGIFRGHEVQDHG